MWSGVAWNFKQSKENIFTQSQNALKITRLVSKVLLRFPCPMWVRAMPTLVGSLSLSVELGRIRTTLKMRRISNLKSFQPPETPSPFSEMCIVCRREVVMTSRCSPHSFTFAVRPSTIRFPMTPSCDSSFSPIRINRKCTVVLMWLLQSNKEIPGLTLVFGKSNRTMQARQIHPLADKPKESQTGSISEADMKIKRMMTNVYVELLLSELPSWDDLGDFLPQDIIQIIDRKIQRKSESPRSLLSRRQPHQWMLPLAYD